MTHPGATEHSEHCAIFEWAALQVTRWPEIALMHAIPNGGYRNKAEAGRLKAAGVKRGVPDICLPVPRHGYHGLYIELKVDDNTPSKEQRWYLEQLSKWGYWTCAVWGADSAIATISHYLDLPK
jgi:hypothetical protein